MFYGCFQFQFVSISRVINHMTSYDLKDRICILFFCHSHSALCNVYPVALDIIMTVTMTVTVVCYMKNKIHAGPPLVARIKPIQISKERNHL